MDKHKILLVDDSSTMRKILRTCLQQALGDGFCALEAADGASALQQLREHPEVCLVLSDLNMPDMDGIAMLEAIRASATAARIPVVMVSAESSQSRRASALDAGADGYIAKPFTVDSVLLALSPFLAKIDAQ